MGGGHSQLTLSTEMYLFIFLAAMALLACIMLLMIGRAIVHRRRFRRRVYLAMARGEAIPQFHNPFHGRPVTRRNKDPKALPPMPVMWESEMHRMDEPDVDEEEQWLYVSHTMGLVIVLSADSQPVSLVKAAPSELPRPKTPLQIPAPPPLREELREALSDMFPFLTRHERQEAQRVPPPRPDPVVERRFPTVLDAPEPGADVRIGVLIAMPCEGQHLSMWTPDDPVDAEVPEVCVGVLECTVAEASEKS